jgi:hypothetical protein
MPTALSNVCYRRNSGHAGTRDSHGVYDLFVMAITSRARVLR